MKKIFALIIVHLIVSTIVYSQDTTLTFFDENWNEISNKNEAFFYRKAFLDSNKIWTVNDFYISNHIQMYGNFKSSKLNIRNGYFIYYHENGNKKSEGKFKNDKKEGLWNYWFENGEKKSSGKYVKNNGNGKWTYWYENGEKKSEGEYSDDIREQEWTYWNENGSLSSKEFFKNGSLRIVNNYFENGNLKYTGNYLNKKKHGSWVYRNYDGRIIFKGNFKKGLKDGEWVRSFRENDIIIRYNMGTLESKPMGGTIVK